MNNMSVEKAWEMYQIAVLSSSKKRSQVIEEGRWRHHISPKLGERSIDSLTSFDLLMLRRDLEKRGLSPQTVRHCLSLLHRILRKAAEWEKYDKQLPNFKGVMPKFDNRRQRFLNVEEIGILLDALKATEKSLNWHDIVLFAVNTGLRRGEIFSLRLCDINFNFRIVAVMDTKSGRNRTVRLNDVALAVALKKAALINERENSFQEKAPKVFSRAVKNSGLNNGITDRRHKIVFHTLRHTFASWLVQDGFPIALVSQMLGHSSINVTMRYSHLAPSQERQAVDAISHQLERYWKMENNACKAEVDANKWK